MLQPHVREKCVRLQGLGVEENRKVTKPQKLHGEKDGELWPEIVLWLDPANL